MEIDWAIMVVMPLRWKSFRFSKDGLVLVSFGVEETLRVVV